jgi:CBS domain-containing protein
MKVQDAMTRNVATCNQGDALNRAAQLMWECDCGGIPVLDDKGTVSGIITDRDVCMASYTRGLPLHDIRVRDAMSTVVHACGPEDSIESALALMKQNKIRRLPVTDGGRAVGMLSLSDVLTVLRSSHSDRKSRVPPVDVIVEALVVISEPRDSARRAGGNRDLRGASPIPAAESRRN